MDQVDDEDVTTTPEIVAFSNRLKVIEKISSPKIKQSLKEKARNLLGEFNRSRKDALNSLILPVASSPLPQQSRSIVFESESRSNESSYEQWLRAIRIVSRLPGGFSIITRKNVSQFRSLNL